jgi:hypothetical protein
MPHLRVGWIDSTPRLQFLALCAEKTGTTDEPPINTDEASNPKSEFRNPKEIETSIRISDTGFGFATISGFLKV